MESSAKSTFVWPYSYGVVLDEFKFIGGKYTIYFEDKPLIVDKPNVRFDSINELNGTEIINKFKGTKNIKYYYTPEYKIEEY